MSLVVILLLLPMEYANFLKKKKKREMHQTPKF